MDHVVSAADAFRKFNFSLNSCDIFAFSGSCHSIDNRCSNHNGFENGDCRPEFDDTVRSSCNRNRTCGDFASGADANGYPANIDSSDRTDRRTCTVSEH